MGSDDKSRWAPSTDMEASKHVDFEHGGDDPTHAREEMEKPVWATAGAKSDVPGRPGLRIDGGAPRSVHAVTGTAPEL